MRAAQGSLRNRHSSLPYLPSSILIEAQMKPCRSIPECGFNPCALSPQSVLVTWDDGPIVHLELRRESVVRLAGVSEISAVAPAEQ